MIKFSNNATSKLISPISTSSTSLAVTDGDIFPNLSTGDYFMITVLDKSGNLEIMKVTGKNGSTFTVKRGQEGTAPRAFQANAVVDNRPTAESLTQLLNMAFATEADCAAGTRTDLAVTPKAFHDCTAKYGRRGVTQVATLDEVAAGSDTMKMVSPYTFHYTTARTNRTGTVHIAFGGELTDYNNWECATSPGGVKRMIDTLRPYATAADVTAGTDTTKVITPKALKDSGISPSSGGGTYIFSNPYEKDQVLDVTDFKTIIVTIYGAGGGWAGAYHQGTGWNQCGAGGAGGYGKYVINCSEISNKQVPITIGEGGKGSYNLSPARGLVGASGTATSFGPDLTATGGTGGTASAYGGTYSSACGTNGSMIVRGSQVKVTMEQNIGVDGNKNVPGMLEGKFKPEVWSLGGYKNFINAAGVGSTVPESFSGTPPSYHGGHGLIIVEVVE